MRICRRRISQKHLKNKPFRAFRTPLNKNREKPKTGLAIRLRGRWRMEFRPIDVIRNLTIHLSIDRLSAVTPHRPRVVIRFGLGRANDSPGGRGADRAGFLYHYRLIPGGRGADRAGILKITKTKTAQPAVRSPKEMLFESFGSYGGSCSQFICGFLIGDGTHDHAPRAVNYVSIQQFSID